MTETTDIAHDWEQRRQLSEQQRLAQDHLGWLMQVRAATGYVNPCEVAHAQSLLRGEKATP